MLVVNGSFYWLSNAMDGYSGETGTGYVPEISQIAPRTAPVWALLPAAWCRGAQLSFFHMGHHSQTTSESSGPPRLTPMYYIGSQLSHCTTARTLEIFLWQYVSFYKPTLSKKKKKNQL